MKKISIKRFKPQQQITSRLQSLQNEKNQEKNLKKIGINRFSCSQFKQNDFAGQLHEFDKGRKSNLSQMSQFSSRQNLLRNMLQSNQRKRSQILSNLIRSKRKLFRTSNRNDQSFKKMIKIKTEQKQNYFRSLQSDRTKVLSKNIESLRPNSLEVSKSNFIYQNSFSQRKKVLNKLSQKQSEYLKNSFNKRIKQIKLRKYFQKDELQMNHCNLFEAYGASLKGLKHQQNQDSIYFSQGIYVLCDGHGSNGKQISSFVSESIHNALSQSLQQNKIDETIILETYRKIDLQLDNSNFDISFSGCTCVALLRYQNTLFCISLGDSRAILCKGYNVCQISSTQKPDKPKEKQRIQNYGGVVRPTQISKDKFVGPMRLWAPGKNSWGPGLALSRAFGDKAARRYGLISVPEVHQIKLTSDEQFIILGSDGLFDYFSDQQICQFVRRLLKDESIPKEEIAKELIEEARKKWPQQESDDISCIIIFL